MTTRRTPTPWNREDRDLLVELRTEMTGVRNDIKELKDNTSDRLARVEQGKLDRTEYNRIQSDDLTARQDHEDRIRNVETKVTRVLTWGSAAFVLLGIAEVALQIYFHIV
jgi:hypothetical protein